VLRTDRTAENRAVKINLFLLTECCHAVSWLSTKMEGRGEVNRGFSCAFDRIVEEFNAEQLHQVLR